MMNFIATMFAVYFGVMAAGATMLVLCMSTWFIRKSNKMSMKVVEEMFKSDDDKVI